MEAIREAELIAVAMVDRVVRQATARRVMAAREELPATVDRVERRVTAAAMLRAVVGTRLEEVVDTRAVVAVATAVVAEEDIPAVEAIRVADIARGVMIPSSFCRCKWL
jgi:hypothetical protein